MSKRNSAQRNLRASRRSLREGASRLYRPAAAALVRSSAHGVPLSKRTRGSRRDLALPFIPPEDWHEPRDDHRPYRIVVQQPGESFRHVLTPAEIRTRLAELPESFLERLECVQLSRMTRKKQSFPCYGMQWGATIYLYPIETSLVETYSQAPKPSQVTEARMYGGRWEQEGPETWKLIWTEAAIRDFYLHNILIHELGHLVDFRNHRAVDRERFAEWFALHYGYRRGVQGRWLAAQGVSRRHHAPARR